MTSFKCMIFDFGNVVAHFDHHIACDELSRLCSLGSNKIYDLLFAPDRLNDRFERGELDSAAFLRELRGALEIDTSVGDPELKQAWSNIFRPNRDVMERLPDFKQECRLVLASNTNPLHIEYVLKIPAFQKGLSCFDSKVLSYEVGHRKPDPRFYEECLKIAQCDPADCLFLDDMSQNVKAAREAGMQACVYMKSLDDSMGTL